MGLLSRQLGSGVIYGSSPTHPFWYGPVGRQVSSGVRVDQTTAMNYSAVWAATRLYTETISTLPRVLFKRSGSHKEHATGHPTYKAFRQSPNPEQSGVTFWSQGLNFCINWGDLFAEIVKDGMGRTVQLWPIHHSRIPKNHIVRNDKGELVYHVRNDKDMGTTPIRRENMLHIPGIMSEDGITGKGVIDHAAESIGMGLATEQHGASFFGNGAKPSVVMTHPKHLGPEAADNLRRSWNKTYNGPSTSNGLLVLEEGTTLSELTITPEQAQFLQCCVAGTKVDLADGTQCNVEDLHLGDVVVSWDHSSDSLVPSPVVGLSLNKPKPCVKVTTARGRVLTCSADHPFLSKSGLRGRGGSADTSAPEWVFASNLKKGAYVKVGIGHCIDDFEDIDDGQSWLLGLLVGDGYVRKGHCSVANDNDFVIEHAGRVVSAMGGELVHVDGVDYRVNTGGRGKAGSEFRTLINDAEIVGKHSHTKRVPNIVLRGGESAWISFLSGYLDADGTVKPKTDTQQPCVSWTSVNRDLLEDCQHMLSMLGFNPAIYSHRPAGVSKMPNGKYSPCRETWTLCVTGCEELRALAGVLKPQHDMKRSRLAAFLDLPDSRYRKDNWLYDRVVSVEDVGELETIGVTIDETHTHVTNGLITHNTRQFNITEIARWYNLPPHLLRELSKSSFNNIESESLHFVLISLMPWLVKLEEECNRQLLTESDQDSGYYFKFMLQGLLRGDMEARSKFYKEMFMMGAYSVNDILELEDRNPIGPEGDQRFAPSNMFTLESFMKPQEDEPEESPEPEEDTEAEAPDETESIQQAALNGGQISALLNIATKVATGEFTPDGSKAMLRGSFPEMGDDLINTLVDDFAKFAEEKEDDEPEEPPPPPFGNEPDESEGEPEDEENDDEQRDMLKSVARKLFVDQLARLRRKEAKGAEWAASEGSFLSRLDEFFERHRKTYQEQIEGPLEALSMLGVDCDPATVAETSLTTTYDSLLELSGTVTSSELKDVVSGWAATWVDGCESFADCVMNGEIKESGDADNSETE